jgi:phage terminase large subunit
MSVAIPANEPRLITAQLPKKLAFLMEMHPYKVAWGGRHGLKTRSFAVALLTLGANQKLRILCCREIMNSIKDSVHQELKLAIEALGLGKFYTVLDTEIRGRNGTTFIFAGLHGQSVTSLKSYAGIDIVWVEEAQTVTKNSWDILLPTLRAENSQFWVSFNPDMDDDDTYVRFLVNPPPGTMSQKMGWQDAAELEAKYPGRGWFPAVQQAKRLHSQKTEPDDYENIWEGKPRTVVAGAIYAREILQMVEENRIRPTPYDPRFPVHRIWDLGWNDAMSIIMAQKVAPSTLNIINYMEDSFRTYAEYVSDMQRLNYLWGTDWLPHDGEHHDPKSGTSAKKILIGFGCKVRIMPKTDPEARIKAARMMFPRVYIDNTARKPATGYLGAARLIECLKRYKRHVPATTGEPGAPVHDAVSHGADAYGGLAEIVDQIRNDGERKPVAPIPGFRSTVPGAGMLG